MLRDLRRQPVKLLTQVFIGHIQQVRLFSDNARPEPLPSIGALFVRLSGWRRHLLQRAAQRQDFRQNCVDPLK